MIKNLMVRAMKVIEKVFSQKYVSRIKMQNFSKVSDTGDGCLQPVNSLFHMPMLVAGCEVSIIISVYASWQTRYTRSQTILKARSCAVKQCTWSHTHWDLSQTIVKSLATRKSQKCCHKRVVTLIIVFRNTYQIFRPITRLKHVITNQYVA